MSKSKKISSSASYSLRRKLNISFALMSILPLLVTGYLVSTYIFPKVGVKTDVTFSLFISIFIAVVGFFVIKEIFDRILSVVSEAKLIAAGDLSRKVDTREPDEVGDLSQALNQLTSRIRSNMDELKNYSEKTTEINLEIQKRVIVLSSLMQVSSLISQGAKVEDILKVTTEKSRLLANSDMAYLFYREEGKDIFTLNAADGMQCEHLAKISIFPNDGLFGRAIKTNRHFVLDKRNVVSDNLLADFYANFKMKNTLVMPIFLRSRVVGLLGVGNNREDFVYNKEDVELLDIFAKQIAIAIENDILIHRVEKLEVKDALTGLYNEVFIHSRLQEEIKRSIIYQRPCAFILFDLDNFKKFREDFGSLQAEAALKKLAVLIRESVTEIDRVGRTADDQFSVILPERNKRQANEIAESIRKKIEFAYSEEAEAKRRITASAGVSENPLDGIEAEELIKEAGELLRIAKAQGKNRVVAFRRAQ